MKVNFIKCLLCCVLITTLLIIIFNYSGVNISIGGRTIRQDNAISNIKCYFVFALFLNLFYATGLFLYPLKTSENQRFSDVFRGYRKKPVEWGKNRKKQLKLGGKR